MANNFPLFDAGESLLRPQTWGWIINAPHFQGFRSTNKRLALEGGIRGTITTVFRFHGFFSTASHEDFALFRPADFDGIHVHPRLVRRGVRHGGRSHPLGGEAAFDLGRTWSFAGGVKLHRYNLPVKTVHGTCPNTTWNASATYRSSRAWSLTARCVLRG